MTFFDRELHGKQFDKGGSVYNIRHTDIGAAGDGSTNDRGAFATLDATGRRFVVPGATATGSTRTYSIGSDLTLAGHYHIGPGAQLKVTGTAVLTFNGEVSAGRYQIFATTGTVTLNQVERRAEWFGATSGIQRFASGDATPSVAKGNVFETTTATGGVDITDLDDGVEGMVVRIVARTSADTLKFATTANLVGKDGNDWAMASGETARAVRTNGKWYIHVDDQSAGGATSINDLGDVNAAGASDNDLLAFDVTASEWQNQTASEASVAKASHTHSATGITSGQLAVERGGIGLDGSSASGGSLLIGHGTNNDFELNKLTPGTGISIQNADGSITITNTATGGTGGGALDFLSSQTATGVSSIDFTSGIDATYDEYVFSLLSVVPATDSVDLWVRTSTDGGMNWDSGANDYAYDVNEFSAANQVGTTSTGAAQILLTNTDLGSAANETGWEGRARLIRPSAAEYTRLSFVSSAVVDSGPARVKVGAAQRLSAADVDAVRFLMSSGNIESGEFRLYGVKDS